MQWMNTHRRHNIRCCCSFPDTSNKTRPVTCQECRSSSPQEHHDSRRKKNCQTLKKLPYKREANYDLPKPYTHTSQRDLSQPKFKSSSCSATVQTSSTKIDLGSVSWSLSDSDSLRKSAAAVLGNGRSSLSVRTKSQC